MDTNNFLKTVLIIVVIYLVVKYRWEIFGQYVHWVEPKDDNAMPTEHVGVSEEHDYTSIKKMIAAAKTTRELGVCFTLIEMFQDDYPGFSSLQKVDRMISLYQEKQALVSSMSPTSIE